MKSNTILYRLYRKYAYRVRRKEVINSKLFYALNTEYRKEKIIVSLTSYPSRFHCIHLALKSIMMQTVKPDRIIVWLDENVPRSQLTPEMIELEQYGVEYRNEPGDLKPHKKYIHAMREFPNDIIITVDDDIIYAEDVIETLLKTHEKFPDAVCARRVHKMTKDINGDIASYNDWLGEYTDELEPSNSLVATGVGGVLYPPHCIDDRAFNEENIVKLSLKADDIWLKFMELLASTKVVYAPCKIPASQSIEKEQNISLISENVAQNMNDIYFDNLIDYYKIDKEQFWND